MLPAFECVANLPSKLVVAPPVPPLFLLPFLCCLLISDIVLRVQVIEALPHWLVHFLCPRRGVCSVLDCTPTPVLTQYHRMDLYETHEVSGSFCAISSARHTRCCKMPAGQPLRSGHSEHGRCDRSFRGAGVSASSRPYSADLAHAASPPHSPCSYPAGAHAAGVE